MLAINVLNTVAPDVEEIEKALSARGGQTIFKYGGMSNGVGQLVTDVKSVAAPGTVQVLRIWTHGGSGSHAVSVMPGVDAKGHRAGISFPNWAQVAPALAQLKPCFAAAGRFELRGCSVGAGFDGEAFLLQLARLLNVEVFGAQNPQPIGPIDWAGPVMGVKPDGRRSITSGKPV